MITVNGSVSDYLEESVATLITRMNIDHRGIAVALNGEVVLRARWAETSISDGDVVEIVTAAAGG